MEKHEHSYSAGRCYDCGAPEKNDAGDRTIRRYPMRHMAAARTALQEAHAKIVKAAAREGHESPAAPGLLVTRQWIEPICRGTAEDGPCGRVRPLVALGDCPGCGDERRTLVEFCDLEVTCERPTVGDFELLAVIEPMPDDFEGKASPNLIRQVPGSVMTDLERYNLQNTNGQWCDHCQTNRMRLETFAVRCTDDQKLLQVGRNCLSAFLGGKNYADIVARLDWPKIVREASEGYGGASRRPDPEMSEVIEWSTSVVRLAGYVSKRTAEATDKEPTSATIAYLLGDAPGNPIARDAWKRARDTFRPAAADLVTASDSLSWARNLQADNDYHESLITVARQRACEPRWFGIAVSLAGAYARERALAAPSTSVSNYQGVKGSKLKVTATGIVRERKAFESQFGTSTKIEIVTDDGNVLVWWASTMPDAAISAGVRVKIVGGVKDHREYRGEKQTILTRCKILIVSS